MKTTLGYLFLFVFLVGCSGDDDGEVECDSEENVSQGDVVYSQFFLRFVDASGVNLLENGSIDPETIVIEEESGDAVPFIYIPEYEIREIQYSLVGFMPNSSESLQCQISAEGFESVEVVFRTEQIGSSPCNSYRVPRGASANGEDLEQIELSDIELMVILPLVAQE